MKKALIISLIIIIIAFLSFIVLNKREKIEEFNDRETEEPDNLSSADNNEQEEQQQENEEAVEAEDNGLKIEILKQGAGEEAKNGDIVFVHYTGTLEDGTKFDSSLDRGTPFVFKLGAGQVIEGWDLGVLGMKPGEKRKLTILPQLGYGPNGIPGVIPPDAVLIFEVELLSVEE